MCQNDNDYIHVYCYNTCTSVTYMYLWLLRCLYIFKKLIKVDELVCEHLECLACLWVVDQHYGDVMDMPQVRQLRREVDVPRDEHHSRGGGVGVGKTTKTLTQLVVSSVLSYGIDVD